MDTSLQKLLESDLFSLKKIPRLKMKENTNTITMKIKLMPIMNLQNTPKLKELKMNLKNIQKPKELKMNPKNALKLKELKMNPKKTLKPKELKIFK